jgi:hypothetical protein
MQKSVRPSCIAAQKTLLEEQWNLGCRDRDHNIDQQRPDGQAREKAKDQQAAAYDFCATHERPRKLGKGNADLLKSTRTQRPGKGNF